MPFPISMIDDQNDLSLEEMRDSLHEKFNLKTAPSTLCEALARLKISRKKTFRDPAAYKEENMAKTVKHLASLLEADKKNFIFIDETGCCLNMSRKFARSRKGTRVSMTGAVEFGKMLKCMKFKGTVRNVVRAYLTKPIYTLDPINIYATT